MSIHKGRRARARSITLSVVCTLILAALGCGESSKERESREEREFEEREVERLVQLSMLGYTGLVEEEYEAVGPAVPRDNPRSFRGITVFGNRNSAIAAFLYDMEGQLVHVWRPKPSSGSSLLWMEPAQDGNLIVLGRSYMLKMDAAGETLWENTSQRFHHGFSQDAAGRIYAMAHVYRKVEISGQTLPILDGEIVILSPDGRLLKEISIFDLLGAERILEPMPDLIARSEREEKIERSVLRNLGMASPYDVFHLNSVEVLDRDIGVARKGNLLLCLRSLDLVLAVDPEEERIVWEWTQGQGELDRPHYPKLLENGNILIFDNGWRRRSSRVVEMDPRSGEIVWDYHPSGPDAFYTRLGGMAQRLPNGNVLVTQQDAGRLFEITRDGDLVWDFWNPQVNDEKGRRQSIYRGWRWSPEELAKIALPSELRLSLVERGYVAERTE